MRLALAAMVVASTAALVLAQDPIDFGADERAEADRYAKVIEELCKNRASNEYFRLSTESNCRDGLEHDTTLFCFANYLAAFLLCFENVKKF